jgi:hypothetical protein
MKTRTLLENSKQARTGLHHVGAELSPQGGVQQMGGRVVLGRQAPQPSVNPRLDGVAHLHVYGRKVNSKENTVDNQSGV